MIAKYKRKLWTREESQILSKIFSDNFTQKVCDILGRTYGSVVAQASKLGLKKSDSFNEAAKVFYGETLKRVGVATRIKKGAVPQNKGKPMTPEVYEKAKGTFFKKGFLPHNTKYDGHERITKDGYVEVRIKKGKYVLKHRKVWEEVNGKIPKDCIVVFLDGNKLNTNIENLEMITMAENMQRNTIQRFPKELQEVILIQRKLNKIIDGKDINRRKRSDV